MWSSVVTINLNNHSVPYNDAREGVKQNILWEGVKKNLLFTDMSVIFFVGVFFI